MKRIFLHQVTDIINGIPITATNVFVTTVVGTKVVATTVMGTTLTDTIIIGTNEKYKTILILECANFCYF